MTCETERQKVQNLRARLADLQAQREQRGDNTPGSDRRLGATIAQVQITLRAAQSDLDACQGKAPPVTPPVIGNELTPPYAGGRAARANLFANGGGETDWGPDPVAGVAHALSGVDHSRSNVVRAAAIDLPIAGRSVCGVDLVITYDMYTGATNGLPPLIGYGVRLIRGQTTGEIPFGVADLELPTSGSTVTAVTAAGSPPVERAHWQYLDRPRNNSVSETKTISRSVEIYTGDRIRLYAYAVAWGSADGVDPKHSWGGVRVIATIAKIRLLAPGTGIL
jgi:hypothetical protein